MNDAAETQTPRYPVRLVALRTGLSPHVLRAWERRYAVVTPTRSKGGQRLYSDHDIERLRRLQRLTDRGHAISRIAALPLDQLIRLDQETRQDEGGGAPSLGGDGHARMERAPGEGAGEFTQEVLRATRRLDPGGLQGVLERAAVTLGVPVFLEEVVTPALDEIGHGWARGSVTVAQEHMATAVILRVLGWIVRVYEVNGSAPRLVVATPPHHVHELGALMVAATAAAEGWGVTYLGPNLPVADFLSAASQAGARAVALSVVHLADEAGLLSDLRQTREGLPEDVPLLVGGAATPEIRPHAEAAGLTVMGSLAELRALLRRLAAEETR